MKSIELLTRLEKIEQQSLQNIKELSNVKEAYEHEKQNNQSLKLKIREQKEEINILKNKLKVSEFANSLSSKESMLAKKELKATIDTYIKYLDSCIAYLSKEL